MIVREKANKKLTSVDLKIQYVKQWYYELQMMLTKHDYAKLSQREFPKSQIIIPSHKRRSLPRSVKFKIFAARQLNFCWILWKWVNYGHRIRIGFTHGRSCEFLYSNFCKKRYEEFTHIKRFYIGFHLKFHLCRILISTLVQAVTFKTCLCHKSMRILLVNNNRFSWTLSFCYDLVFRANEVDNIFTINTSFDIFYITYQTFALRRPF